MISSSISQIMVRNLLSGGDEVGLDLDLARIPFDPLLGEREAVLLVDAAGAGRHHHQAFTEEQGFLDGMGDQDDGLAGLLPELEERALASSRG